MPNEVCWDLCIFQVRAHWHWTVSAGNTLKDDIFLLTATIQTHTLTLLLIGSQLRRGVRVGRTGCTLSLALNGSVVHLCVHWWDVCGDGQRWPSGHWSTSQIFSRGTSGHKSKNILTKIGKEVPHTDIFGTMAIYFSYTFLIFILISCTKITKLKHTATTNNNTNNNNTTKILKWK